MPRDPFSPFAQGKGNAGFRKLEQMSSRTPEQFERDRAVRDLQKQRRRELLRRLFRRG